MFTGNKILILGFARSGYEAAKFLLKRGNTVYLTDMKEDHDKEQMKELEELGKKEHQFSLDLYPELKEA